MNNNFSGRSASSNSSRNSGQKSGGGYRGNSNRSGGGSSNGSSNGSGNRSGGGFNRSRSGGGSSNRSGGGSGNRSGGGFNRNRGGGGGGNRGRSGGFNRGRSGGGRGRSGGGRGRFQQQSSMHPDMYVLAAQPVEEVSIYVEDRIYSEFNLNPLLLRNLNNCKYVNPTKIQDKAIPLALEGKDVLAIASTGSGKTAAFLIPMVNKIMADASQRCLIILPTRELAQQTEMELKKLTQGTNIRSAVIIGGVSAFHQKKDLRRNPNFVIATPGRLKDLYQQKVINLSTFNNVVLDEVDRMLDMGFIDDIRMIVSKLRDDRQSIFVSATMDKKAEQVANELLRNANKVQTQKISPQANVEQDVVRFSKGQNKIEILHELLIQETFTKVLVFSRTKRGADRLSKDLYKRGFKADSIHGDKSQSKRSRVIDMYRKNKLAILVATDVVARGLDIRDISHVINYDEPASYEDYIHRIGRTGRIGKTGTALTFIEGNKK